MISIDLFSGIGGMSSALSDVCVTACYCDIDPVCRELLTHRMLTGDVDSAPVCPDVKLLTRTWLDSQSEGGRSPPIDIILAGVPCTGFSALGKQEAFDDVQSMLFFEMLRVCDEFQPSALFMENVPNIVKLGMHTIVGELFEARGYNLSWCTLSASDVGAPHKRCRWYCIAYKPTYLATLLTIIDANADAAGGYNWDPEQAPHRMVQVSSVAERQALRQRMALLGNSVVPFAVRTAFEQVIRFEMGAPLINEAGQEAKRGKEKAVVKERERERIDEMERSTKPPLESTNDYTVNMLYHAYEAVRQDLNRQDIFGNTAFSAAVRSAFEEVLACKRNSLRSPVVSAIAPSSLSVSGTKDQRPETKDPRPEVRDQRPETRDKSEAYPKSGVIDGIRGAFETVSNEMIRTQPYLDLDIHPAHYTKYKPDGVRRNILNTLPEIVESKRPQLWGTPRKGLTHTSNVLTERTSHDLPTQIRFERRTPDSVRSGVINPQFIEWMMGYPLDWTSTDQ